MLKEQRPMKFFTVPGDRLKEFAKEAKARGILYVVIKDKVNPDQTEVMVFADDAAKMNRVLDRMNLVFCLFRCSLFFHCFCNHRA